MSEYKNTHDDIPQFEPWLGVMASSVIPVVIALYFHSRYLLPLIVAAVALFLASLVMLRRQTIQRRMQSPKDLPEPQSVARSLDGELELQGAEP
jgi:hypothetical protein